MEEKEMKKLNIAMLVMLACLCFVGAAMAVTDNDTVLTGTVDACSIGLTVPVDQTVALVRGSDNIQGIGNVEVINNCNTPWTVNVVADSANMYFSSQGGNAISYTYLTTVMYVGTTSTGPWIPFSPAASNIHALTGTTPAITLDTGSGAHTIPVYVKQPVTSGDSGGNYRIKFTFQLIQG